MQVVAEALAFVLTKCSLLGYVVNVFQMREKFIAGLLQGSTVQRTGTALLLDSFLDFPDNYICGLHPQDLTPCKDPIFEYPAARRSNLRYLARVPFLVSPSSFIDVSFVIDIGAPGFLYLSAPARTVLENMGKLS